MPKFFSDADGKTGIGDLVKLPAKGHDLVKSERKKQGVLADGYEEYWKCSKCHKFFQMLTKRLE